MWIQDRSALRRTVTPSSAGETGRCWRLHSAAAPPLAENHLVSPFRLCPPCYRSRRPSPCCCPSPWSRCTHSMSKLGKQRKKAGVASEPNVEAMCCPLLAALPGTLDQAPCYAVRTAMMRRAGALAWAKCKINHVTCHRCSRHVRRRRRGCPGLPGGAGPGSHHPCPCPFRHLGSSYPPSLPSPLVPPYILSPCSSRHWHLVTAVDIYLRDDEVFCLLRRYTARGTKGIQFQNGYVSSCT